MAESKQIKYPQEIEAEIGVLGSLFVNPSLMSTAVDMI